MALMGLRIILWDSSLSSWRCPVSSLSNLAFFTDLASVLGIDENDSPSTVDLLVKGLLLILSWLTDSLSSSFFSMEL